ncbi:MAG: hypothetical protein SF097_15400 [Acidobacteriota bacterium]|nr:hypothetical protein [Acidobacteriota bacterium]
MNRLRKLSTGRNVVLTIIIWLAVSVCLFNFGPYTTLRASDGELLEERFGYSAAQVAARLETLGETGRALYRRFQYFDAVNALLTAAALTLLMSYLLMRLFPSRSALWFAAYLPLLIGALELLENSLLLALLRAFPEPLPWVAAIAGWTTRLKLTVSLPLFLLIVVGLLALAVKRWWRS